VPLKRLSQPSSNGPGGAPGWYSFPGLAPGSYLVCFTPPPTFVVTTPNQGADNLDSDINPATNCTPVVTLAANEGVDDEEDKQQKRSNGESGHDPDDNQQRA